MKFTLSWLRDHLETEASLDEIAEALTDLGLEVEEVETPARRWAPSRIARVIEAVQHPNADRLRCAGSRPGPTVPAARSEEVQVVCGAPNARTGLVGVFAPVGTHVPGTGVDLKPGVIRGVESNGMLCSEREMLLSDDHEGIIDLPEDAPLGARFIDYAGLNDPMIYIKITPNRPDALGVRGIARDLAARGLGLKPCRSSRCRAASLPIGVTIDPALKDKGCPLFAGRVIRGVKNGPSPDWLQKRLRAIGLRPISALVDITNFFTFDREPPAARLRRRQGDGGLAHPPGATGGEELLALDGKTYAFEPGMMVISDDNGPESIAGIMGGEVSGVTGDTVDVFVESAYWDPITMAATGRALRINSDARYRFERGVDPAFTVPGLELATRMILDICGGEASEVVMDGAVPDTARSYRFDPARVGTLVGMDIPRASSAATLVSLGFRLEGDQCVPPSGGPTSWARPIWSRRWRASPADASAGQAAGAARAGRAAADPDADPAAGTGGAADAGGAGLQRMRHLFLHRRPRGGAVRRRFGCGEAGEPDLVRDEPSAARPAAGAAAGGGAQPGAGLCRSGAVRGRAGVFGRRAGRAGAAGGGAAGRRGRRARSARVAADGGCLRRQGRCRGGAGGDRGAGEGADRARRAGLVPSRAGRGRSRWGRSWCWPRSARCIRRC
jgi:tRNA-binding EMAP/Myf-like protein